MSVQSLPPLPLPQERRDGRVMPGCIRPGGSESSRSETRSLLRTPGCPSAPSPEGFPQPLLAPGPGQTPLKVGMIHTVDTPLLARAGFKPFLSPEGVPEESRSSPARSCSQGLLLDDYSRRKVKACCLPSFPSITLAAQLPRSLCQHLSHPPAALKDFPSTSPLPRDLTRTGGRAAAEESASSSSLLF